MSGRVAAFVAAAALLALVAAGYLVSVALRERAAPAPSAAPQHEAAALPAGPHLVFLQPSGGDPTQNTVAIARLDGSGQRQLTDLRCSRAYFSAGHGVCLGRDLAGAGALFDAAFHTTRDFRQPGIASRARVSADGRLASTTVFVAGHGYADIGFSTQTLITNLSAGVTTDLESFAITRDGQRIQAPDFNFWGVTFAGGSAFYATLGTGGHTYLIQGDAAGRSARVLRDGVECPSLSPDGTRIVYKKQVPGGAGRRWQLHVLDLRTMADRALAETRSVDDQVEWLDAGHVLYGLNDEGPPPTLDVNLWSLGVDGDASPVKFLAHAASPAVVRS